MYKKKLLCNLEVGKQQWFSSSDHRAFAFDRIFLELIIFIRAPASCSSLSLSILQAFRVRWHKNFMQMLLSPSEFSSYDSGVYSTGDYGS